MIPYAALPISVVRDLCSQRFFLAERPGGGRLGEE
jgi:hypothetical protein